MKTFLEKLCVALIVVLAMVAVVSAFFLLCVGIGSLFGVIWGVMLFLLGFIIVLGIGFSGLINE